MIGCFLTSVASISANVVFQGWESQGSWNQWLLRVVIGYSAALIIAVGLLQMLGQLLMLLGLLFSGMAWR